MSRNGWLYAFANPINLTDPTGYLPRIIHGSGYAEGWSVTMSAGFIVLYIYGEEVVYDFVTMERAHFTFNGTQTTGGIPLPTGGCTTLAGASFAPYVSTIFGFNRASDIGSDYRGPFAVLQIGLDVPVADSGFNLGGGRTFFSSVFAGTDTPNLDVFGYTTYGDVGFGAGLPLAVGAYMTHYNYDPRSLFPYTNGSEQMAADILEGTDSPIDPLEGVLPLRNARQAAVEDLRFWRSLMEAAGW